MGTVITGKQFVGEEYEVRNKLETLIQSLNKNTFDIAECLHVIKSKGYFNKWGYSSFNDYIQELEIKQSKAHYLTRIVDIMEKMQIPRESYEPLGIGKLREITSLNPNDTYINPKTNQETPMAEFIKGFVEKGKDMELTDLRNNVRILKGFVGENDLVWLNFSVTKQAAEETIKPALELAKQNAGSVGQDDDGMAKDISDGKALEYIAVEYINDPANSYIAEHKES